MEFKLIILLSLSTLITASCASKPYCYNEDLEKQLYCERGVRRSEELQRLWNEKRQRDSIEERVRFHRERGY